MDSPRPRIRTSNERATSRRLRSRALKLTLTIALSAPAMAIAAEPVADADEAPRGSSTERKVLAELPNPVAQAARQEAKQQRQRRQRRRAAAGPFHPVDAGVDYGDVQAAFGNARGRSHEGQDIFAPGGTPVLAPADGIVVDGGTDGGRGNWIAIYDPKREQTYSYFHLQEAKVESGEKVAPGQRVGLLGCTGSCFGEHLHFEVRDGEGPYGAARDPLPLLEKWNRFEG